MYTDAFQIHGTYNDLYIQIHFGISKLLFDKNDIDTESQ